MTSAMDVVIDQPNKDEVVDGPLSILMYSVKNNTPILVSLRNNHKLLGHLKAFDRHCNLVMTSVKEIWSEKEKRGAEPVQRDRKISKLFVRGDSVVIVVKNPSV
jgi:small nuclear ribonucleoprotein D2